MDIRDVRLNKLRELIGDTSIRGAVTDFCNQYDLDTAYIRLLLYGKRRMGEKTARKIEAAMSLPDGYFDDAELTINEDDLAKEVIGLEEAERQQVLSYIKFLKSSRTS